jgi:hypothetical protein
MNINDEDLAVAQLMTEKAIQKLESLVANNFDNFNIKTKYKVFGLRIDKAFELQFKEATKHLADQ